MYKTNTLINAQMERLMNIILQCVFYSENKGMLVTVGFVTVVAAAPVVIVIVVVIVITSLYYFFIRIET